MLTLSVSRVAAGGQVTVTAPARGGAPAVTGTGPVLLLAVTLAVGTLGTALVRVRRKGLGGRRGAA